MLAPQDELAKVPYITFRPNDGRIVQLLSYFAPDTKDWHLYYPVAPGELGRISGGEPVQGAYYADTPVEPERDSELPIGTLVLQHLSFPETLRHFGKLEDDVHRFAAVMEKYHLISGQRRQSVARASLLATSELEYLLLLLRSYYDLLQLILRDLGARFVTLGDDPRRVAPDLPDSFAKVVLQGDVLRTAPDILTKYTMPQAFADWYAEQGAFFQLLRKLRDGVAHYGRSLPTIYELEEGLAVDISMTPWSEFDIWADTTLVNGKLGPLRKLMSALILHALNAGTSYAHLIRSTVALPPPLAGSCRYILRSPIGNRLVQLVAIMSSPWEGISTPAA
jgi:hypothetical protein